MRREMILTKAGRERTVAGETGELRRRIAQLEDLNRDLVGLIENSYDALTIMDGEGRHLLVSPAFERITGRKIADVLGRKARDFLEETGSPPAASEKVIETGLSQTAMVNGGAGRQLLATAVPAFDRDGKISRIYCNLRDITELIQLKEKFEQSQTLITKYLLELHEVRQSVTAQSRLVAHSRQMKHLLDIAYRVARADATVLVLGESGVGKELIARIIHDASPRGETGTFVKVNCAAIPAGLLESELFGYDPGAFTGASRNGKPGYFEVADKGTLFLDEIGSLPISLQVKLLSVLQDQEVTRLGGCRPRKIDVRIIAATNEDLERKIESGDFRKDLFYRLNVVPLSISPLRERTDDIPFLLVHYLGIYNKKYGHRVRLSKDTVDTLCAYRWPGNVRELANLLEYLVITVDEEVILPEHLPDKYVCKKQHEDDAACPDKSLHAEVRKYETVLIKKALSKSTSLEEAAHRLGISLATLVRRKRLIRSDGYL